MRSSRFIWYIVCTLILTFASFSAFSQNVVRDRYNYTTQELAMKACFDAAENVISKFPVNQYSDSPSLTVSCEAVVPSGNTTNPQAYQCGWVQSFSSAANQQKYNRYGACGSPTQTAWAANCGTPTTQNCANQVTNYQFKEIENPCANSQDIDNSMRSPSSNGTGNVCINGCAYSVAIGYEGTWPVGRVFFDSTALKRQCQPGDETPTDDPLPPDTPPLDIDGETPDPGPEPGDGDKPGSSGGGTCDDPPKCQGDSIQCNILYQSWANRCKNPGGGGEGGEGEPTDLTPITSRWDNTFGKGPYGGDENTPLPGISSRVSDVVYDSSSFDTSGFGLSRSCPTAMREYTFSWGQWSFNMPFNELCEWFDMIGRIVMVLGAFFGCVILLRGKS